MQVEIFQNIQIVIYIVELCSLLNLEIHKKIDIHTHSKPIPADNESTQQIVSVMCRNHFERFKLWQRMNICFELVRN